MKKIVMVFMFFSTFSVFADSEKSLKITYQVNQHDPTFKTFLPGTDAGKLCFPSALAHRLYYIKKFHTPAFSKLLLKEDAAANVEKFISYCKTNPSGGTSQKRKVPCIEQAFKEAGYSIKAFSIGEDSATEKRAVNANDIIEALEKDQAVILHIAWWRQDPKTKVWRQQGSHSVNVYQAYVQDKSKLLKFKIVDPGVDYSKYHPDRMYDEVTVVTKDSKLEIESGRFNTNNRKAKIKNIYVFGPLSL